MPARDQQSSIPARCEAVTKTGEQCRRRALPNSKFCKQHEQEAQRDDDSKTVNNDSTSITIHVSTGAAKGIDQRWLKALVSLLSTMLGEDGDYERVLREFVVYAVDDATKKVVGFVFYSPGLRRISISHGNDALLTKMLSHVYVELEHFGKKEVWVSVPARNKDEVARYQRQGFTISPQNRVSLSVVLTHELHPLPMSEVKAFRESRAATVRKRAS